MIHKDAVIHSSAVIDETAEIEKGAFIGEGCVIKSGAKVGYNAVVEAYTTVGENTLISGNAHIGGPPQDVSYKGEDTKLIIGKNCVIREFCTLNRGSTKENWETVIGDDCYFMAYSHVGHDCVVGNNVVLVNNASLGGHVHVGNFVTMAGFSGAHQFTRVGDMCMIGNRSTIIKDIPPYCMFAESRLVGLNSVGLKRRGVEPAARSELKKAFKIYTDTKNKLADVPKLLDELEQFEVIENFKAFLKDSKRSFQRG